MAQHKHCKKYPCDWCASIGYCPEECNHFKHKDEVIVVRCYDCRKRDTEGCPMKRTCRMDRIDFCSRGERKDDGRQMRMLR